ncbi:MAG: cyclodeaminase/cyclohydrolase family protein [Planctomycetota bacterium]
MSLSSNSTPNFAPAADAGGGGADAATDWSRVAIGDFIAQLIAKQPTPGGGAACAVNAAVGAATIAMAAGYTSGPKYQAIEAQAQALYRGLQEAARGLIALAAEDEAAYAAVNAVLALPKEPDAARKLRWEKLKAARLAAARVPVRMVEQCVEALRLAAGLKPICNRSILSDLGAGSEMVAGALSGAAVQIRANLDGLKGGEPLAEQLAALEAAAQPLLAVIRAPDVPDAPTAPVAPGAPGAPGASAAPTAPTGTAPAPGGAG